MSRAAVWSVSQARWQASRALRAGPQPSARSHNSRNRRSLSTRDVVSITETSTPPMPPLSSRTALWDKVK